MLHRGRGPGSIARVANKIESGGGSGGASRSLTIKSRPIKTLA